MTVQFENATALVFKHSNSCDLSDERLTTVEEAMGATDVPLVVLSVQADRELSDAFADHFGIRHASPQAIALRRGQVIAVRSHWAITSAWIDEVLPQLQDDQAADAQG